MEVICYLSNGYPTLEKSYEMAKCYAEAGCKIIEVDFPSSNPFLESEYIANRMHKALEKCADFQKYMEYIIKIKSSLPQVKLLILAYEETIREIGVEKFIDFCKDNDLYDILLVGLKNDDIKNILIFAGLKVSCYIQYHLPSSEVESAKCSNGFVYLQAKPYGDQEKNLMYPDLKSAIHYLRSIGIDRPIYCGVGVHTLEDAKMVKEAGADAAFIGSAILKLQDNIATMQQRIQEFLNI